MMSSGCHVSVHVGSTSAPQNRGEHRGQPWALGGDLAASKARLDRLPRGAKWDAAFTEVLTVAVACWEMDRGSGATKRPW